MRGDEMSGVWITTAAPTLGIARGSGRSSCTSPVVGKICSGICSCKSGSVARLRRSEWNRRRIRSHDQIVFLPTLQRQRWHPKGPVLIDVVPVKRTKGRFRDAPRHTALLGIGNLTAHGVVTSAIEQ